MCKPLKCMVFEVITCYATAITGRTFSVNVCVLRVLPVVASMADRGVINCVEVIKSAT